MINNQTVMTKDLDNKKLLVVREFNAPLAQVWKAWTDSALLDEWWAPRPWKTATKSMNFSEGGKWLYSMVGPDGSRNYCRVDFKKIMPQKSFSVTNGFCDEDGNPTDELPSMEMKNVFSATSSGTKVEIEISFDSVADLEKIVEMGFQQGFTAAHGNLDELLAGK